MQTGRPLFTQHFGPVSRAKEQKVPTKKSAKRAAKTPYVIVRTHSAGCFAGELVSRSADGTQAELRESRRLWYWSGAASLSQLAEEGTSRPLDCKFPTPVGRHCLVGVIEVLYVSPSARLSIESVPVWGAK